MFFDFNKKRITASASQFHTYNQNPAMPTDYTTTFIYHIEATITHTSNSPEQHTPLPKLFSFTSPPTPITSNQAHTNHPTLPKHSKTTKPSGKEIACNTIRPPKKNSTNTTITLRIWDQISQKSKSFELFSVKNLNRTCLFKGHHDLLCS